MFTDNLLVYCQYFTAPHFLLIGYGYAAARESRKASDFPAAPPQVNVATRTPSFRLRAPFLTRYPRPIGGSKLDSPVTRNHV